MGTCTSIISANGNNYTIGGPTFDSPWHLCYKTICSSVTMTTSNGTYSYTVDISDIYNSTVLQASFINNLYFDCLVTLFSTSGASKGNRTEITIRDSLGRWYWFDRQVARTAQNVRRTGSVLVKMVYLPNQSGINFYFQNNGSGNNTVSATLVAIKALGINTM